MSRAYGALAMLVAVVFASGCAGPRLAPVEDRAAGEPAVDTDVTPRAGVLPSTSDAVVSPIGEEQATVTPLAAPSSPAPSADAVNPAVVALLNAAGRQSRAGEHDRAAASLERALQIEPDNAWLWHRLALTHFDQRRYEQAESFAAKSNLLSGGDRRLQIDNWRLIESAREQYGDLEGARAAGARAAELAPGSSN